jgi:hypothetical protein
MGSSDEDSDSGEEEMELRPVKRTPWLGVLKDLGIDLIEKFNAVGGLIVRLFASSSPCCRFHLC